MSERDSFKLNFSEKLLDPLVAQAFHPPMVTRVKYICMYKMTTSVHLMNRCRHKTNVCIWQNKQNIKVILSYSVEFVLCDPVHTLELREGKRYALQFAVSFLALFP